jgi:hypothetical protein
LTALVLVVLGCRSAHGFLILVRVTPIRRSWPRRRRTIAGADQVAVASPRPTPGQAGFSISASLLLSRSLCFTLPLPLGPFLLLATLLTRSGFPSLRTFSLASSSPPFFGFTKLGRACFTGLPFGGLERGTPSSTFSASCFRLGFCVIIVSRAVRS